MQINKQGTPNQQIALTLSDSHCSHLNPHVDRLETATNSVCKKKNANWSRNELGHNRPALLTLH